MSRRATMIVLTGDEQGELDRRVRARTGSQQAALRAQIVLRAGAGERTQDIAAGLGIAPGTVRHWRNRFAAERLAGLGDRPHRPAPRLDGPERQARIVVLACQKPADLGWAGQTHWSIVDLAHYIGEHAELAVGTPSKSTVGKILQAHGIRLERL